MISLQDDLSAQLRLYLLSHFATSSITPAEIAERTQHEVWAIKGMLERSSWGFDLCLELMDAFDLKVELKVADPSQRELERWLESCAAPAYVTLGQRIASR